MNRDRFNQQSLGISLNKSAKQAKILMVGAGGIGCELLKNLVLVGFGEVHIVDLDTIDLSNLNRQFLFRHEHIKKSKALVAKEAAHRFNPNVRLEAHHANIKDAQFNVEWFKSFTMVFNALDNLDARRYVNKMCLAADVPLLESGTTGFNGQIQVIKKGVTACYDCTSKEAPKSYPVCTIRSTPSQPIHCIVWGKSYLLSEIFGASDEDDSAEMDHSQDSENAQEIAKLRQEAQALKKIRSSMGTETFPQLLFDKVYKDDIIRLRSMEEMWKSRRPPEALDYVTLLEHLKQSDIAPKESILREGQRAWTLEENVVVFKDSLERLSQRMEDMHATANGSGAASPNITFDKDDEDTLDFVTASANLRSIVFGIETKSRFDIKQMAGNIIPAIATTNAIVAGLCVLESFKVLRGHFTDTREVFLSPFASERLLASDRIRAPNPDCPVCSVAQTTLLVDISRATLNNLVEDFLRLELGYGEEFVVNNEVGLLYDVDETENLDKKLSELGIKGDSFLTVIDEDEEDPRVNLVINVQEASDVLGGKPFKLSTPKADGDKPSLDIPRRKKSVAEAELVSANSNGQISAVEGNETVAIQGKRKAADDLDAESFGKKRGAPDGFQDDTPLAKRGKVIEAVVANDTVTLDDDANGAILIDDD
ncbi:MAG: E1 ubiquitin-activating protein uba2 [Claussenomyces sp. TS43310]|nr:MAG: E1 ubiquitin-activating protein uba2 [Claussenomyces sp. TS43310]